MQTAEGSGAGAGQSQANPYEKATWKDPATGETLAPFEQIAQHRGPLGMSYQRTEIAAAYNPTGLQEAITHANEPGYMGVYQAAASQAVASRETEQRTNLMQQSAVADLMGQGLIQIGQRKSAETGKDEYFIELTEKGQQSVFIQPNKGAGYWISGLENIYRIEEGAVWGKSFDFIPSSSRGNVLVMVPQGTRENLKSLGIDQPFVLEKGGEQYVISGKGGENEFTVQKIDPFSYTLGQKQQMPISEFVSLTGYKTTPETKFSYTTSKEGVDVNVSGLQRANPYELNFMGLYSQPGLSSASTPPTDWNQYKLNYKGLELGKSSAQPEQRMISIPNIPFLQPAGSTEVPYTAYAEVMTTPYAYNTAAGIGEWMETTPLGWMMAPIPKGSPFRHVANPISAPILLIGGSIETLGKDIAGIGYVTGMGFKYLVAPQIVPRAQYEIGKAGYVWDVITGNTKYVSSTGEAAPYFEWDFKLAKNGWGGGGARDYSEAQRERDAFLNTNPNYYQGLNIGPYPEYVSPKVEMTEYDKATYPSNFLASGNAITFGPIIDIPFAIGQVGEMHLQSTGVIGSTGKAGEAVVTSKPDMSHVKAGLTTIDESGVIMKDTGGVIKYVYPPGPAPNVQVSTNSLVEAVGDTMEWVAKNGAYVEKAGAYYGEMTAMYAAPAMKYVTPVVNVVANMNRAGAREAAKFMVVQTAFEVAVPGVAAAISPTPAEDIRTMTISTPAGSETVTIEPSVADKFIKGMQSNFESPGHEALYRIAFAGAGGYMIGASLEGVRMGYPTVKEAAMNTRGYALDRMTMGGNEIGRMLEYVTSPEEMRFSLWKAEYAMGRRTFPGYDPVESARASAEIAASKVAATEAATARTNAITSSYLGFSSPALYSSMRELKRTQMDLGGMPATYPQSKEEYDYEILVVPKDAVSPHLDTKSLQMPKMNILTGELNKVAEKIGENLRFEERMQLKTDFNVGLRQKEEMMLDLRERIRTEEILRERIGEKQELDTSIRLGLRMGLRLKVPPKEKIPGFAFTWKTDEEEAARGKPKKSKPPRELGYNPSIMGMDIGKIEPASSLKKAFTGFEIRGRMKGK